MTEVEVSINGIQKTTWTRQVIPAGENKGVLAEVPLSSSEYMSLLLQEPRTYRFVLKDDEGKIVAICTEVMTFS